MGGLVTLIEVTKPLFKVFKAILIGFWWFNHHLNQIIWFYMSNINVLIGPLHNEGGINCHYTCGSFPLVLWFFVGYHIGNHLFEDSIIFLFGDQQGHLYFFWQLIFV